MIALKLEELVMTEILQKGSLHLLERIEQIETKLGIVGSRNGVERSGNETQKYLHFAERATTDIRSERVPGPGSPYTVLILFEDQNGDLKYVDGEDDSGTELNAKVNVRLYQGRRYVLRIRLYSNFTASETAVMLL